jgi:hypothetical protein
MRSALPLGPVHMVRGARPPRLGGTPVTPNLTLDIEVYDRYGKGEWAQAHYLVHGWDDVMWTNTIENALQYLQEELGRHEEQPNE